MDSVTNHKHLSPRTPSFLGLVLFLTLPPPPPAVKEMRNGRSVWQFVTHNFCCCFFLRKSSLFPAPSWGHSQGRQSSINFSSGFPMGFSSSQTPPIWVSFHGIQSFRNRLLQVGSSVRSGVLPINLFSVGASSQFHRSCQESAPV